MVFSRERLEGRALEHAFAGDQRQGIRMLDEATARYKHVTGPDAQAARRLMRERVAVLRPELEARGLHVQAADVEARLAAEDAEGSARSVSVDLRVWDANRQGHALVEMKWTRGPMAIAEWKAEKCLPKLQAAALRGTWAASRRRTHDPRRAP